MGADLLVKPAHNGIGLLFGHKIPECRTTQERRLLGAGHRLNTTLRSHLDWQIPDQRYRSKQKTSGFWLDFCCFRYRSPLGEMSAGYSFHLAV